MSARAPLLVGLVVALAASGLGFFFLKTGGDRWDKRNSVAMTADFADASGLRQKTRVQINGLDAGRVEAIEHARDDRGRPVARVHIRIGRMFSLHQDAELKKSTESLLGDFRLDLDPGGPDAPLLHPGGKIGRVKTTSDIDEIKGQLLEVVRNVNDVTRTLGQVLASPDGQASLQVILRRVESALTSIDRSARLLEGVMEDNEGVVRGILGNVGRVAGQVAHLMRPGGDLTEATGHLSSLSGKLDRMADSLGAFVNAEDDGKGGPSLKNSLNDVSASLEHIGSITRKIDEGKGTIGRVVNDPGIANKVEATLDSAGALVGNVARLQTQIELRGEYGVPFSNSTSTQTQKAIKNTVALRLWPKPDKYYLFEAISDPRGRQTRTLTTTQLGTDASGQPSGPSITAHQSIIAFNDLKFSAQFAKRYYFATLRFGIIENTGGLGINLHGLGDRAEVRLDAFEFDRRDPNGVRPVFPRLRATGIWQLANHVHAQVGVDDPFTDLRTWFAGGILRFTDDDLKGLLLVAPRP